MADRPSINLKVYTSGAGQAAEQLEVVADAQRDVADATKDAAKAAAAQGDAGAKAESKLKKLWAGLKEGAGQAAGAAAGLSGMAITLKGELDPATQQSVGALQGLSGVLAAFGPVGALASVAVSGIATAVAFFSKDLDTAAESSQTLAAEFRELGNNAGFLARAMGPAIAELERFVEARNRLSAARDASDGIFGVPIEQVPEQWGAAAQAMQGALAESTKALTAAQGDIDSLRARRESLDFMYFNRELARLEGISAAARAEVRDRTEALKGIAEAYRQANAPLGPDLPPGGLPADKPGGPRAPDDRIAKAVAFFTRQAALAEANLVGAFDAALIVSADNAAKVAAAAAADAAKYGELFAKVVRDGTSAQQDAIRTIEADAAQLMGMYESLTSGVSDFAAASAEGFAAAAVAAAIYGGSLKDAANQALQAATVTAATQALIETAKGLGYLAAGAFGYGPGIEAAGIAFASAATWAAVGGAAAAGAAATGGFGGTAGGPGLASLGPDSGAPSALDRPAAAEAPEDREFFINLNSGAGGSRPISRGEAGAVAMALIDIFKAGGLRLEARRA